MKKISLLVLVCLLLVSCGNKKEEESKTFTCTLKPSTTTISGDLGEYFQVVDGTATIEKDDMFGLIVSVKIKKIKEFDFSEKGYEPVGTFGQNVTGNYGFGIMIKDKNGNLISSTRADADGFAGCYSSDDLKNIWDEAVGEDNVVRWAVNELEGKEGELNFTISSIKKEATPSEYTSTGGDNSGIGYSEAEIDDMLDQLESMLNQLAHMDDLSDAYDSKEEEILQLLSKIENADLTTAQEKRFYKLDDRFDDL